GHFEVLNANLNQATGVDAPRIQVAFKAVELKGAVTAERFAADQKNLLSTLPSEQQTDIARYLSPNWIPPLPPEGLSGASNMQLGAEYGLGLKGDPARVQAAEDEIEKREEKETGFGVALPGGGPAATAGAPGTTKVSSDVAIKILENISKGETPFRPEL